jgi:hypothetical protein
VLSACCPIRRALENTLSKKHLMAIAISLLTLTPSVAKAEAPTSLPTQNGGVVAKMEVVNGVGSTNPLPCQKWHKALREHGLPVKVFAPIMWRESRCQAKAIGWNYKSGMSHRDCKLSHASTYRKCKAVRSYDVGLLQINSSWKTVTAQVCKAPFGKMLVLQDPECNLKVAKYLYKNGGMSHWRATSGRVFK